MGWVGSGTGLSGSGGGGRVVWVFFSSPFTFHLSPDFFLKGILKMLFIERGGAGLRGR